MQAASALIAIGTVVGKTNPVHLVLIALLEVSGFVLNGWLLQTLLQVSPHANTYNYHTYSQKIQSKWGLRTHLQFTAFLLYLLVIQCITMV